jgi:hypothetical protein
MTSYKILEFGDDYIELLEAYQCNSKIELHKREGELIRQYKDICVNRCIAGRTKKQFYEDNKEKLQKQQKEYREENKEKIKEKHNCECGGHYTLGHKARHEKTKMHLFIVNKLLI